MVSQYQTLIQEIIH